MGFVDGDLFLDLVLFACMVSCNFGLVGSLFVVCLI